MDAREQYNAAVTWSSRQVSSLKVWLRSVEKQISEATPNSDRYSGLMSERRQLDSEISTLTQERTMIRKAKRRAERRLRIA